MYVLESFSIISADLYSCALSYD